MGRYNHQQTILANLALRRSFSPMPAVSTESGLAETHDADNRSSSGPSTKVDNVPVRSTCSSSTTLVSLPLVGLSSEAGCRLLSRRTVCRAVAEARMARLLPRTLDSILPLPVRSWFERYKARAAQKGSRSCVQGMLYC